MASFAMVYAGAPLCMWKFAILAACFVNNITASFYSDPGIWATPHELVYGTPFEDPGVVMPFAVLAWFCSVRASVPSLSHDVPSWFSFTMPSRTLPTPMRSTLQHQSEYYTGRTLSF